MSLRTGCIWICCALIVIGVAACIKPKKKQRLPRPFSDPRKAIHNNFTRDFH